MIWKADEIVIPSEDPFKNDRLERKRHVKNVAQIIQRAERPLVLTVDAPWGCGKTTFLRLLRADLKDHRSLWLDAWKVDFMADPMLALVGEMTAQFRQLIPARDGRELLRSLQKHGAAIGRRAVPVVVRAATAGLVEAAEAGQLLNALAKGAGEEAAEIAEEYFRQYSQAMESFDAFRSSLNSLTQKGEGTARPVVFFVDELDRCRPDFAVSLLEVVKHLFSVDGMVFVLGLHQAQLENAVRTVYGTDIDAHGYLRRLVDLRFRLPAGPTRAFVHETARACGLLEVLKGRRGDPEDRHWGILEVVRGLADVGFLSVRAQQRCLAEIGLVYQTTPKRTSLPDIFVAFLIALRVRSRALYEDYCAGRMGAEHVLGFVNNHSSREPEFEGNVGPLIKARLFAWSGRPGEREKRVSTLEERLQAQSGEWLTTTEGVELGELQKLTQGRAELDLLVERLELLRDFQLG